MSKFGDNMPREFPSVHLAYPVAMEAYEWAARRMDTMDSRIQTILALGTSLSVAAPVVFAVLKIEAHRGWIIALVRTSGTIHYENTHPSTRNRCA